MIIRDIFRKGMCVLVSGEQRLGRVESCNKK